MASSEIRQGGFVRNNRPKANPEVGKILELRGDDVRVEFWDGSKSLFLRSFLEPLPDGAPEVLLWERDESLARWAKESPLKLIAAALSVSGNRGTVADIKEKLGELAPIEDDEWKRWWQSAQRKLKKSEGYFRISKEGKDSVYILLSNVDDVPIEAPKSTKPAESQTEKSDLLAEWQDWFLNGWKKEPPENYPKKAISDALAKWPADTIEPVLKQTIQEAEGFLASKKPTPQPTLGWLEAVGQASLRWWECTVPYSARDLSARSSDVLLELAKNAGYAKSGEWLLWAHALSGQSDESWRQGFAAGMWAAIGESGGNASRNRRNLFRATAEMLGRQSRADLAREIALAAFHDADATPRYSALDELDQVLEQLTPGEEAKRLLELIALSSESAQQDKDRLLDYIANSRHAVGPERLNLLVAATLLLTDGKGPVAAQTSRELAYAFAKPSEMGYDAQTLFKDTRAHNDQLRDKVASQLEEQSQTYELRLRRSRLQIQDLGAEVDTLQGKLMLKSKLEYIANNG